MRTITAALLAAAAAWAGDEKGDALRRLETMRVSVDFQDARLSEAVDYLREATGLNFVLQAGGAEGEAKVRLKARDLAVKSVLKLMLSGRGLAAAWREGAVVILPESEVQDQTTLRMYDVRAMLVKIQDFPGPRMELVTPGTGPFSAGIVVNLEEPRPMIEEDFLVTLVRENTGGRSWDGPKAGISLANGRLVVNQTPAVHREIQDLLARLGQYR
jgi:hypothetical protein